jgi:hypothetical protein
MQTEVANLVNSTADVQTQAAGIVASTAAAQTAFANAVASTLAAMVTDTPEFTLTLSATSTPSLTETPTLTSTPTFTLTSNVPRVSVSVETNCRSGPGTVFEKLGVLKVGESAEIVGRDLGDGNWIIRLPSNPAIICWVWRAYATTTGDTGPIPVFTPPPTPTPSASFSVTYVEMVTCLPSYAFTFKIANTGIVTWESVNIVTTDTVTSTVTTHTRDSFKRYTGCPAGVEDQNLDPGEIGYPTTVLPGQFTYNPTGHAMTAAVTVCSLNGQAGTCLSKTISFTP